MVRQRLFGGSGDGYGVATRLQQIGDGQADMAFLLPGFPPEGFDGNSVIWA